MTGIPAVRAEGLVFGSVCSGIEAASVAWLPLGWRCAWVAEIDPFCNAVLAHRFPAVRNYGDFTTIPDDAPAIAVLVGGTPCQSFSVAGLRGGLDDDRGNLALEFCRLADRLRPRWLLWENVPGVLSSGRGRDFGAILGALAELGYGWAYRILDAQYFGIPQRRRRVFLVGCLGDWRGAAAVLFERHSLSGHPAPRRASREDAAAAALARPASGDRAGADPAMPGVAPAGYVPEVSGTLGFRSGEGGFRQDLDSNGAYIAEAMTFDHQLSAASERSWVADPPGRTRALMRHRTLAVAFPVTGSQQRLDGTVETLVPMSGALRGREGGADRAHVLAPAFAVAENQRAEMRLAEVMTNITNGGGKPGQGFPAVLQTMAVRRLLPLECERLQGFEDGWTDVPYRGKRAADGNRYRAIGNSMAVPVVRWIGERIARVDALMRAEEAEPCGR